MSEDILKGIIEYAKKEIRTRIEHESKKIIGEVVTDVMGRLKFETYNNLKEMRTEIYFIFKE
jgi:hypothetical protein